RHSTIEPVKSQETSRILLKMLLPALRGGGYEFKRRVLVGQRPGGGKHLVDVVASDAAGRVVLISVKWQQVTGTTEQKVPYEVMCLAHSIQTTGGRYAAAYVVLGGKGWTLRDFYTQSG